ncbi:MAG: T9SS type A sorting domain-containing protein, partial [Flavobacteriales bacterium]|nr:T9SS type A sorting domain-containing protein [Flavobacteriales bacterium]
AGASLSYESKSLEMGMISIRPNPANGRITVQAASIPSTDLVWQIMDVSGRLVLEGNWMASKSDQLEISLDRLSPGTYQLSVIGTQYFGSERFVIDR